MRERMHRHTGTSQSTESTKILGPTEWMEDSKLPGEEGYSDGDELPLGEQSSKENIRKDDEIRTTKMRAEAEVPRVRDFTIEHHCRCTRGLVDRRGSTGERASWEASQRHPQEDAVGMPIRHTEHCTYF